MKDKEKQIEEIQKTLCTTDCKECMSEYLEFLKEHNLCKDSETEMKERCIFHEQAEKLYDKGYRKLPKDSVVLSREELENIKKNEYRRGKTQQCWDIRDKERRQTARNIADWINYRAENSGFGDVLKDVLKELSKTIKTNYKVEIKEDRKC